MLTPSPINAPGGSIYPGYDPLAAHFLSGGQMGYMPNAQFLTPAEYGAFRQTPATTPFMPTYQAPTLWQSYLQANRGNPFGGMGMQPGAFPYAVNTYTPGVNPLMQQVMGQRSVMDAGVGFGVGAANVGMQTGMGALGGMLGGAMFGLPGMVLGGAAGYMGTPDVFAGVADRTRQMRSIQQMTMPKIFAGPDVSSTMGRGLGAGAARGLDESIRQYAIDDMIFNEADYRDILSGGTQAGLFDYSGDAASIKRTLKVQMKNVRMLKDVLEIGTSGEAIEILQWAQQMGAGPGAQGAMLGVQNMAGRMTGLNAQDLIDTYGRQGALTYSQLGMTGYQGAAAAMATAGNVELMRRTGMVTPGEVARAGGVSGMTQNITESSGRGMQMLGNYLLPGLANSDFSGLNMEKVAALMSGKMDTTQLMLESGGRVGSYETRGAYEANRGNLMQSFMDVIGPQGPGAIMLKAAEDQLRRLGKEVTQPNLATALQTLGVPPEVSGQMVNMFTSSSGRQAMLDAQQQTLREISLAERTEREQTYGIRGRVVRGARRIGYETIGTTMSAISDWFAEDDDYDEGRKVGIFNPAAGLMDISGIDTKGYTGRYTDQTQTSAEKIYKAAAKAGALTSKGRQAAYSKLRKTLKGAGLSAEFDNAELAGISASIFDKFGNVNRTGVRDALRKLMPDAGDSEIRAAIDAVIKDPESLQGLLSGSSEDVSERSRLRADILEGRRLETQGELMRSSIQDYQKLLRPSVSSRGDAKLLSEFAGDYDTFAGLVGLGEAFEAAGTERSKGLRKSLQKRLGLSSKEMSKIFDAGSKEDQMQALLAGRGITGEKADQMMAVALRTSKEKDLFGDTLGRYFDTLGGMENEGLQIAADVRGLGSKGKSVGDDYAESEAAANIKASIALTESLPVFLKRGADIQSELIMSIRDLNKILQEKL